MSENIWINVADMLPEVNQPVLVWAGARIHVAVVGLSFRSAAYWESCESGGGLDNVTHWQPLPEPPTKG